MIGLDTNIMIRYLVQDDPVQSEKANRLIESALHSHQKLWISQITLCEISWVLEKSYKIQKKTLISIIKDLLYADQLVLENDDVVWQAIYDFEKGNKIGFPDCLIGRQNLSQKCSFTYTFDTQAAKHIKAFKLLL